MQKIKLKSKEMTAIFPTIAPFFALKRNNILFILSYYAILTTLIGL